MPTPSDLDRRAHAVFMRALDVEPASRAGFARAECGDDAELCRRVEALLSAAARSDGFLEAPAQGEAEQFDAIPDAVGSYLVVGVLGVGGMATVYEALQEDPKRRVALKVLHQSMARPDLYQRFRFETEALARLHHPGIAQIYEAGAAQLGGPAPAPFFAMELVPDALPITTFATQRGLTLRDRVAMLASVCDAVHYGHQRGIIHRDLKPANILVDGNGAAKVIDFGVARAADPAAASITATSDARQIIGTLNYMSPEQCDVDGEVDTRADVYSLGVMLYQMACGRLPHDLRGLPAPAALHAIVHDEPARPPIDDPRLARDLDAIILRAIEKQPERRYASAAALAADLRRLLADQPIEARPPGLLEQARRLARRNPGPVTAAAAIAAAVILVAAVSTGFAVRLAEEAARRRIAEEQTIRERDEALWEAYTASISGALSAWKTGEFLQMRARLQAASFHPRTWEWGFLSRLAERSETTIHAHDAMIQDLDVSPDGGRLVTGASDGSVRVWRSERLDPVGAFTSDSGAMLRTVRFVRDGSGVLTGDGAGVVRLLDAESLEPIAVLGDLGGPALSVGELPDGRLMAAGAAGSLAVWSADLRPMATLSADQPGGVNGVEVSPDGATLATFNDVGAIWIRDSESLEPLLRLDYGVAVSQVRFSGDGRLIGATGASGTAMVWRTDDGTLVHRLRADDGVNTVRSIAFTHDGSRIAVGQIHRGIMVFSGETGEVVGELGGHTDAVMGLVFWQNDALLASASWDRTVRTWRTADFGAPDGAETLEGHTAHVLAVAASPTGDTIASVSRDGALRLWSARDARSIAAIEPGHGELTGVAYSRDGARIAASCADGAIVIVDAATGRVVQELSGAGTRLASVDLAPGGDRVAAGGQNGSFLVWDLATGAEALRVRAHAARVNSIRFSPDGASIATGSRDATAAIWDARTGAEAARLTGHESDIFAVLFDAEGKRLFTGCRDQTVRVWRSADWTCEAVLGGHGQYVTSLAMSPDGSRLAAGSWFGEIVLFDVPRLDLIASFRAHEAAIRGVAFTADGRWLASASYDSTVRLFDSATREEAAAESAARGAAPAAIPR